MAFTLMQEIENLFNAESTEKPVNKRNNPSNIAIGNRHKFNYAHNIQTEKIMIARTPEMQEWIKKANEPEFREYLVNKMHDNNHVVLNGKNNRTITIQQAIADFYEAMQWLFDLIGVIAYVKKYKKISIAFAILIGGGGIGGIISTGLKIWNVL